MRERTRAERHHKVSQSIMVASARGIVVSLQTDAVKLIEIYLFTKYLRIGSCLACIYRVINARGKLGEHERRVTPCATLASRRNCSWFSTNQRTPFIVSML